MLRWRLLEMKWTKVISMLWILFENWDRKIRSIVVTSSNLKIEEGTEKKKNRRSLGDKQCDKNDRKAKVRKCEETLTMKWIQMVAAVFTQFYSVQFLNFRRQMASRRLQG